MGVSDKNVLTESGVVAFPSVVMDPPVLSSSADFQVGREYERGRMRLIFPADGDKNSPATPRRRSVAAASEVTPYRRGGINE